MRTFAALLLAVLTLFVAGCGSDEAKFHGKWREFHNTKLKPQFGGSVEFLKDGTFVTGGKSTGKWSLVEKDRLKLEVTALGSQVAYMFTVSHFDSEMSLRIEKPNVVTMKVVKGDPAFMEDVVRLVRP